MNRKITIIGVALSAVLAVGACAGGGENAGDTGVAGGGTTTGAISPTTTPTDTGLGATGVGATAGATGRAGATGAARRP